MLTTPRYVPTAIASLCLTFSAIGCMPSDDTISSTVRAGAGASGVGSVIGGSTAVGVAGRGDLAAAGSGGTSTAATAGRSSVPPTAGASSPAGSGSGGEGGMSATAGSRAQGRGGSGGKTAAGSGGSSAAGSGGSASSPTSGQVWMPKPGTTWQWQLTGSVDTSIDAQMFDIDLFTTSASTIQSLHAAGKVVICYFSAGSYEPDRPDSDALSKTGLGRTLDGWPDEKWLDIRATGVRDLMKARLDTAKSKGCDGVEPDNVDGFDNENGLGLTQKDALEYDRFLATESHARGLSIGLKNSLGLVSDLVSSFDWALNEECLQYDECDTLEPFIKAGKAVFHCEYGKNTDGICGKAPEGFSTIVKNLDLDAFRLVCK